MPSSWEGSWWIIYHTSTICLAWDMGCPSWHQGFGKLGKCLFAPPISLAIKQLTCPSSLKNKCPSPLIYFFLNLYKHTHTQEVPNSRACFQCVYAKVKLIALRPSSKTETSAHEMSSPSLAVLCFSSDKTPPHLSICLQILLLLALTHCVCQSEGVILCARRLITWWDFAHLHPLFFKVRIPSTWFPVRLKLKPTFV